MLKDLISMRDLTRQDIEHLIVKAHARKKDRSLPEIRRGKIASLFFENSTRTRVSSEIAALNLGYEITGFSGTEGTSVKKGEPLLDTVRMFSGYGSKLVFIRHNLAGATRFVADHLPVSIVNAGDGSNGHPTQTLLDLFTIQEKHGTIDGLTIAMVGDLKYGRTVHSLLQALEHFQVRVILLSPPQLAMPAWRVQEFRQNTGRPVEFASTLQEVMPKIDVLYVTRIQRERFPTGIEGEIEFTKVSGSFLITPATIAGCRNNMSILHPLPRDKNNIEIDPAIDLTPNCHYFDQAENGLYMREAIIEALLSRQLQGKEQPLPRGNEYFQEESIVHGSKMGDKLVYRLDEGILIDHIDQGKGHYVHQLLRLGTINDHEIVVCSNIRSKKTGRKDVLAIHNYTLTPEDLYKVALVSPNSTINYIKNKQVIKKGKAKLPHILEKHIICNNQLCISRKEHQEHASSKFYVEAGNPWRLRCHYCEQVQNREEIKIDF